MSVTYQLYLFNVSVQKKSSLAAQKALLELQEVCWTKGGLRDGARVQQQLVPGVEELDPWLLHTSLGSLCSLEHPLRLLLFIPCPVCSC